MKTVRNFRAIESVFPSINDIVYSEKNMNSIKKLNDDEGIFIDIAEYGLVVLYDENVWEILARKQDYLQFKRKNNNETLLITPSFGHINVEKNDALLVEIEVDDIF